MLDSITNWVLQNILGSISEFAQQILTAFGEAFNIIFSVTADFNNEITKGCTGFTLTFAVFFILILTMTQYFKIYVLETDGDPEADPLDMFVRASEAICFAVSTDYIFDFFTDFSASFVSDFQSFFVDNVPESNGIIEDLNVLLSIPSNFSAFPAVIIIISVGILVALVVFCVSSGIRAAELILFKMLFPLFSCDVVTKSRERWNAFITSYLVTWLAYGLQIVSFKMFSVTLTAFVTCTSDEFWKICSVTIGWIVLMIRSPKWLEKFAYASGISRGLQGGLRMGEMVAFQKSLRR